MHSKETMPSIKEMREFWPRPTICDGISINDLLAEIKQFALVTFDAIDVDGNQFLSQTELEVAIEHRNLDQRQQNYVRFLLKNLDRISCAYDDHDGPDPIGISRNDIAGISRSDLVLYFSRI